MGLILFVESATQRPIKKVVNLKYVETDTGRWLFNDVNRPTPPVITPGTKSARIEFDKAPSDAIFYSIGQICFLAFEFKVLNSSGFF